MHSMYKAYTAKVTMDHVIVMYCPDHVPMSYVAYEHSQSLLTILESLGNLYKL